MRVLVVHSGNEKFVKIDRELLALSFEVVDFHVPRKFPNNLLKYFSKIKNSDILFCWFASWNSMWALFFAKIFLKPSVLVIGGYDLANLPEAGYGQQRGGPGKWVSRFGMKLASTLCTNSHFSQIEAEQNVGISPSRLRVIYHGVPDSFDTLSLIHKERLVLTVGKVDFPNLKRKGLEPFVRTAALLPDVQFVLAGAWADDSIDYLRMIASKNVYFTGFLSDKELLIYYQKASVYVQASLHEGFGMSVAEAMLARCVPVVTSAGSLPEVVENTGIIIPKADTALLAAAIRKAFQYTNLEREFARDRILENFSLKARQNHLVELINSL